MYIYIFERKTLSSQFTKSADKAFSKEPRCILHLKNKNSFHFHAIAARYLKPSFWNHNLLTIIILKDH